MQTALKTIAALCSAGTMAGCAFNQTTPEVRIAPTLQVHHSYESADGYYALGRYYHGSQRFGQAMDAYRKARMLDPSHVKAANAMAILYTERGEFEKAIALFHELIGKSTDDVYLFSNLGYAYYLKGDYTSALPFFEKATVLDPKNVRAWNNLGNALEKIGELERAHRMHMHAREVESGKASEASSVLATTSQRSASAMMTAEVINSGTSRMKEDLTAKAIANNNSPKIGRTETELRTEVSQVGPSIFEIHQAGTVRHHGELRRDLPLSEHYRGSVPIKDAHANDVAGTVRTFVSVRVEVSNGNGITGMAKSVGKFIGGGELKVVRLTNQRRFNVPVTRVEYKEGYEQTARTLAEGLGQSVVVQPNASGFNADVRVVLGRDNSDVNALRASYLGRIKKMAAANFSAN